VRRNGQRALVLLVFLVQPQETPAQQWVTNGNDINHTNPGNVGIGTTTPRGKFDVAGDGGEGKVLAPSGR
jgi:hypothetical protein